MADDDTELMTRAQRGDDDAFKDLFDRNYRRAVGVAYRSLGDLDLAEDIAAEAFARIYESRHSFKASAKFTTYLYRTVVNLCINAAKHRLIVREEYLDESAISASPDADPSEQVHAAELARRVKNAVLALPANQRVALVLTKYEGLSYQSAAEAMRVSVGAVESLLHRAKANLRKSLADHLEAE